MTPKAKAVELVEKYLSFEIELGGQYDGYMYLKKIDAIQCAIICVEEILKAVPIDPPNEPNKSMYYRDAMVQAELFWQSVLTELKAM